MWGPGKEMMKAYEKSRSQLTKRKTLKENFEGSRKVNNIITIKKISKQEREELEAEFLEKLKNHRKKSWVLVLSITAIVVVIGYYTIFRYL